MLEQGEWDIYQKMEIRVHDGRQASRIPRLEHEGFELAPAFTPLELMDSEYIKTEFYNHCVDLIKSVTECETARAV